MKTNEEDIEKERLRVLYAERKQRRIDKWDQYLEIIIDQFPLLLQEDLKTLKEKSVLQNDSLSERGIFVFGKVGSGKTVFVIFLLIKYLREQWIENKDLKEFLFISPNEFFLLLRRAQAKKIEVDEFDLLDKYCNIDILVLDDIGIEKTSDWTFQMLFQLINFRYLNKKKTIFTSNLSLEQLSEKLGDDRIPSRILQMCEILEKTGIDFRTKL
jgi:DNA replication protein DnaC